MDSTMTRTEAQRILHNLFAELETHGAVASGLLEARENPEAYQSIYNACVDRIIITSLGQTAPFSEEWAAPEEDSHPAASPCLS